MGTAGSADLERFCEAMNREWRVVHYEVEDEGERVRVHYVSVAYPDITWSHLPFDFDSIPKVGTVGRIGFIANGDQPE